MTRHRSTSSAVALLISCSFLASACGTTAYSRRVDADRRVSVEANAALRQARVLGTGIEARSYRGVVALFGQVGRETERRKAEAAVAGVAGVLRVNNLILVVGDEPERAAAAAESGAPLTARVQSGPSQ